MDIQIWDYNAIEIAAKKMWMVLSEELNLEFTILEFENIISELHWESPAADNYRFIARNYFSAIKTEMILNSFLGKKTEMPKNIFNNLIELLNSIKEFMQQKDLEVCEHVKMLLNV